MEAVGSGQRCSSHWHYKGMKLLGCAGRSDPKDSLETHVCLNF